MPWEKGDPIPDPLTANNIFEEALSRCEEAETERDIAIAAQSETEAELEELRAGLDRIIGTESKPIGMLCELIQQQRAVINDFAAELRAVKAIAGELYKKTEAVKSAQLWRRAAEDRKRLLVATKMCEKHKAESESIDERLECPADQRALFLDVLEGCAK